MFRSVTESRRLPKKRRMLYREEGLVVGALVCLLMVLGFAWLMAPPGPGAAKGPGPSGPVAEAGPRLRRGL